jgi:hypothetical protein
LYKLPPWNKTRHYCFASELLDVESGASVKEDLLDRKLSLAGMDKAVAEPVTSEGAGTFRLDKYQISVAGDGQISWQADGGINRLVGGQCIIKSGVLFIGSQEYAEGEQSKRQFITKLKQLPQWDRTKIWSHSLALRACEPQLQGYWPGTNHVQQCTSGDRAYPEKRIAVYNRGSARPLRNLLPSGFRLRTPSLHLPHEWSWACGLRKRSWRRLPHGTKAWLVTLISLVIAGVLLGLTLGLKGVEKSLHWFRSSGERQAG